MNYKRLGDYIEQVERRNNDLKYGVDSVKGVSNRAQMNFIFFSIAILLLFVFNVIVGYNCCNDCP